MAFSDTIESRIGAKVRFMRREVGWTQVQLHKKSGVSISYISDIERGHKMPSFKTLNLLLEAMGYEVLFEKKKTIRGVLS